MIGTAKILVVLYRVQALLASRNFDQVEKVLELVGVTIRGIESGVEASVLRPKASGETPKKMKPETCLRRTQTPG